MKSILTKKSIQNLIKASAKKSAMPKSISPMLATLVNEAPSENGWTFEIKWDGYRAVAFCDKSKVNLFSRNNKSFNDKFYPIRDAMQSLQMNAVLDGEIVVLDENGISNFSSLQNWRSEADGDLVYYVFDILWLEGYNLMSIPLIERRKILQQILPQTRIIRESEYYEGSAKELLKAAQKMGLEGIIAKKADSEYYPGERGNNWLKIKLQKRHEVVIGGYTINENTPKLFSSVLVGVYENGSLRFRGKIGTGFNDKMQKSMMAKFKPLIVKNPPFTAVPDVNKPSRFRPNPPHAEIVWLSPKLVCEVSYTELTEDNIMRHPSFEGMRLDKDPKDVHDEKAKPLSKRHSKKLNIQPVKKGERKTLLNPTEASQVKNIKGHDLKFSNLNKVFWPEEGYTKRDLLNYYYQVAPYILPYLKDRPQSLNRFPNGIYGKSFYQKDVTGIAPVWVKKAPYHTSLGEDKNFIVVQDEADLLWMANLGAIEMNAWNSTIEKPDNPTWCIIDIDPTDKNTFEQVIETAKVTKHVLDEMKVDGYCKTSGSTGLHIYIPLGAKYTYDECQLFGRIIANRVHDLLPKFTSVERYTDKRRGKIYVDFLQNRPKATLAAPYAVRPKPGAPVSMPLDWSEVKKGLKINNFTLKNAIERIRSEGDIFKPVLGKGINITKVLKEVE